MSSGVAKISVTKQNPILKTVIKYPVLPTFAFFILMVIVFIVLSPANRSGQNIFLSPTNLTNIFEATAGISIGAFAVTLVLLVGCIDLSAGAIIALSSVTLALSLETGMGLFTAILLTLAVGIVCGALNSLVAIKFKVPPFLATISMALVFTGFTYLISGSRTLLIQEPQLVRVFGSYGSGASFLGLPVQLCWTLVFLFALFMLINKSKYGRWAQATGGNIQAAYSSGVNVKMVQTVAFIVVGLSCAFVGILFCARLSAASANFGSDYTLYLIIAAVLGGTNFSGNGGNVFGTLLGSLVMGVLTNGLGIIGVNIHIQLMITGVVIVCAVVFSIWIANKK